MTIFFSQWLTKINFHQLAEWYKLHLLKIYAMGCLSLPGKRQIIIALISWSVFDAYAFLFTCNNSGSINV